MERLFSEHIKVLRAAAADDIERKVRVCCLLRSRRIFLWAALPLVIALGAVAVILISFYISVLRGKTDATLFLKIADIFSIYSGILLVMTFVCLGMVKAADKVLSLLSSMRPDDGEVNIPVTPLSPPAKTTARSETPETAKAELPTLPESEAGRLLVSSLSVCENAG